jgi:circadian clock protein KaiB
LNNEKEDRLPASARSGLCFCIYVSDNDETSRQAMANLRLICREHLQGQYFIEVVNASRNPSRAARDGILVTPTLVKLAPEPRWSIEGDLSEEAQILEMMGHR